MFGEQATVPSGIARAEDPGLSTAMETAENVPAESVRRNGKQLLCQIVELTKISNYTNYKNKKMKITHLSNLHLYIC